VAKKRILVLCPFPIGVAAGQRLKYEQYFDDWVDRGFEVTPSPFMGLTLWRVLYKKGHLAKKVIGVLRGHARRTRDLFRIRQYDVVYVFMWVTPIGTSVYERLTRILARRLIYDVEDNVLVEQKLAKADNPNPLARLLTGPGKARFLIRRADHVITSSPFLNDLCLESNENRACTYISSSVDTDRFVPANQYSNAKKIVIGWTGTFSSKIYLDLLRDVFLRLSNHADFTLRVIGNFDYQLPGVNLEVVQWRQETEVADMQAIDIGVYPLPINDWVLGKSGLKAIQYMAFGIPCVATDVGTTPILIRNGENGLLVRSDDEWVDALKRLMRDPALRRKIGEKARQDAVARYSLDAIADEYAEILNSMDE
jgi:glycosyltransferase involved in cell wall biosynthesis